MWRAVGEAKTAAVILRENPILLGSGAVIAVIESFFKFIPGLRLSYLLPVVFMLFVVPPYFVSGAYEVALLARAGYTPTLTDFRNGTRNYLKLLAGNTIIVAWHLLVIGEGLIAVFKLDLVVLKSLAVLQVPSGAELALVGVLVGALVTIMLTQFVTQFYDTALTIGGASTMRAAALQSAKLVYSNRRSVFVFVWIRILLVSTLLGISVVVDAVFPGIIGGVIVFLGSTLCTGFVLAYHASYYASLAFGPGRIHPSANP